MSQIVTSSGSGSDLGRLTSIGVVLADGTEIKAKTAVLSGATPHVTFNKLLGLKTNNKLRDQLGQDFVQAIENIDYTSPVTKINGECFAAQLRFFP